MGDQFGSDGRLKGDLSVVTIQCDMTTQMCPIPVKASSVALVFLTAQSLTDTTPPDGVQTFASTAVTVGLSSFLWFGFSDIH